MKVLVVGSGFGGVKAALELQKQKNVELQLISASPNFSYHAALYRSATGKSPLEVVIPLRDIFDEKSSVDLVLDKIEKIIPDQKMIHGQSGRNYSYDILVLAIGQVSNYFEIEGMAENSYSIDVISQTIKLREHLHDMVLKGERHNLNFVVVGGGASGVELAAELKFYIDGLCRYHHKPTKTVDVILIEAGNRLLPLLHPSISKSCQKRLQKIGVKVMLDRRVEGLEDDVLLADDLKVASDTVVWTAGFKNNPFFEEQTKGIFKFGRAGRVEVSKYLSVSRDIYVIGDSADTLYSGMAQTALHHAEFVSQDINNRLAGRPRQDYKPKQPIYAVPVGRKFAVLQWGRVRLHGKLAWLLRRLADLRLFIGLEPFKKAVKSWRSGHRRARITCHICQEKVVSGK